MRDSIVFYRSFYEAIKLLPAEQFKASVVAIMEYGLDGIEPTTEGIERTVFCMAKPQLDANNRKYENGSKGGRPKTKLNQTETKPNQEITKPKPNDNQTETKPNLTETKTEKSKPNVNVNDNENVNVNDNYIDMSSRTSPDRLKYPYKDIVDYLNNKAGTSFRSTSKDTQKHIRARFEEGYTLEDFYTVIDKKCKEWGTPTGNKDMRPYLRPSTLFGSKFGDYLGAVSEKKALTANNNNFERRQYDMNNLEAMLVRCNG